ncbi:DUF1801 domain-containing protein [Chitinophaga ginsengisoli]|uniref:Uncharacterized protein DUF1801 n=1 Tax=Chitinophaga ginsengisoli TaxID=363837 RepID=A0A2P8FMX1_9BACT|nr:DUF1801 domain-containing protein [Chitinophaga ginsengisoli]PSL23070.1 uncharacterized protein DUF1801 [Chitinophaga ginsengisoli]
MAEQKTKPTEQTVASFLDGVPDENVRKDCFDLAKLMEKATGFPSKMWGTSIVGFGQYHYKYESGHEGYSCLAGFAPRKQNIALYVMAFDNRQALLDKLGKYKAGKGCLYIKKLSDVDGEVLKQLVKESVAYLQKKYPNK